MPEENSTSAWPKAELFAAAFDVGLIEREATASIRRGSTAVCVNHAADPVPDVACKGPGQELTLSVATPDGGR